MYFFILNYQPFIKSNGDVIDEKGASKLDFVLKDWQMKLYQVLPCSLFYLFLMICVLFISEKTLPNRCNTT
jgi:hypothetical protein